MPYIPQHKRDFLQIDGDGSPGELNYTITKICDSYLGSEVSYTRINDIIGALECAKMEFYRRLAVPYEDKKIEENGDVYQTRV